MDDPWTRDGGVRADVVQVAPDVSGIVTEVPVRDNQRVPGAISCFASTTTATGWPLAQADAAVATGGRPGPGQPRRRALPSPGRHRDLPGPTRAGPIAADQAIAAVQQTQADRDLAQLNLDRTEVRAPVNGIVTNLDLQVGDYVAAGRAVIAVVDADSFHVDGYFEETKLARIQPATAPPST